MGGPERAPPEVLAQQGCHLQAPNACGPFPYKGAPDLPLLWPLGSPPSLRLSGCSQHDSCSLLPSLPALPKA